MVAGGPHNPLGNAAGPFRHPVRVRRAGVREERRAPVERAAHDLPAAHDVRHVGVEDGGHRHEAGEVAGREVEELGGEPSHVLGPGRGGVAAEAAREVLEEALGQDLLVRGVEEEDRPRVGHVLGVEAERALEGRADLHST